AATSKDCISNVLTIAAFCLPPTTTTSLLWLFASTQSWPVYHLDAGAFASTSHHRLSALLFVVERVCEPLPRMPFPISLFLPRCSAAIDSTMPGSAVSGREGQPSSFVLLTTDQKPTAVFHRNGQNRYHLG